MAQPFPRYSKNLKPQQCLGAARARKNERMRCEGADTLASFVLCLRVRVCVVCVSVWEGACFDFRGCFKFLRHVSAQHAGNNKTPLTHSVIHARRTSCVWTIKIAGNVQFGEKASLNKVICHYTLF